MLSHAIWALFWNILIQNGILKKYQILGKAHACCPPPPPPHHLDLPLHTYWWMFVSCSIGRDSSWYTNDTHFLYTHFAIYSCTVNIHKNTGLHEVQIKTKHESTFPPTLQICLWLSCAQSLFALIYSCFKVMYTEANICTSCIEDGPHACQLCMFLYFLCSFSTFSYLLKFIYIFCSSSLQCSPFFQYSSILSVLCANRSLGLPISAALHALPSHVLASYSPRLPRPQIHLHPIGSCVGLSPSSSFKGQDKREGGGSHNWGNIKDDVKWVPSHSCLFLCGQYPVEVLTSYKRARANFLRAVSHAGIASQIHNAIKCVNQIWGCVVILEVSMTCASGKWRHGF